jgi:hypothetical protein
MKKTSERDTAILLAALDREIDLKCLELKEKHQETALKKLFFTSCITIILVFFLQMFFQIFNVNLIFIILIYQAIAALIAVPVVISKTVKGGIGR